MYTPALTSFTITKIRTVSIVDFFTFTADVECAYIVTDARVFAIHVDSFILSVNKRIRCLSTRNTNEDNQKHTIYLLELATRRC